MPGERSMADVLRNILQYGDLSFRDFVELALYHPEFGYYTRGENRVGKGGDYVTAPTLSPAFSFAIAGLFREFLRRAEGAVCSFVDIGCGDGGLVRSVAAQVSDANARFFGVDRSLARAKGGGRRGESGGRRAEGGGRSAEGGERKGERSFDDVLRVPRSALRPGVTFVQTLDEVPRDGAHLLFSNELYDAFPFARLVRRGEHLHELWVSERDGSLDWSEHEAAPVYEDYFAANGVELAEGQFADVSLEWEAYHEDVLRFLTRGLVVTIDYGYRAAKLFHPRARRFGTAAAYAGQRVHRDLLANPGAQDLTAHINFSDLERAGERHGAPVLFFDSQALFLLSIGITDHESFRPVDEIGMSDVTEGLALLDRREEARRLVLPDGMGEELRVLVQAKDFSFENWSFQRKLF